MNATKQRNGNKRYSGVFDAPPLQSSSIGSAGAGLKARSGKNGASKDRQGQVYEDEEPSERSILRPSTPEASSIPANTADMTSSSYGSPVSVSSNQHTPIVDPSRSQALRSDKRQISDLDVTTRPRTRTLDDKARKSSFENKVRNRMGSTSAAQSNGPTPQPTDSSSSIGFPSIMPISPAALQRRLNVKPPSRPQSPTGDQDSTLPTGVPSAGNDTARILYLMKTTAGRMHGILFFRMDKSGPWSSGYCAINVASGTLIYQMKGDVSHAKTLIPDLRGCTVRTQIDRETNASFLEIASKTSALVVHLKPHVPETFESWLAALLCWQPLSPKVSTPKINSTVASVKATIRKSITNPRRNSSVNLLRDAAIIKVGKMLYWNRDIHPSEPSSGAQRISTYKQQRSAAGTPWTKVSCTLQENGLLKLYKEPDPSIIHQIPLSALSRFAIQRLHATVLEDEYCLAIYPQYRASNTTALDLTHPIFLSLETRILFEVWFVLLRAFTTPELYGPEQPSVRASVDLSSSQTRRQINSFDDLFRVERILSLRIVEAKMFSIPQDNSDGDTKSSGKTRGTVNPKLATGDYHAEALIDGETRGRTAIKTNTGNPFWREDYDFFDLPPVISSAAVLVKLRSPGPKDWYSVPDPRFVNEGQELESLGQISEVRVAPLDDTIGTVKLQLDDFERGKDFEKWWDLTNEANEIVGEILMKIRIDEAVVLMARHYEPMSEMLHRFSSGLTQQIAFAVPIEHRKLHETLLSIFQFSGHASDWLMSLVEDEIDGIHKGTPAPRYRYSRRIASNDSYDSGVERELILRDAGKNATQEANLLFRGNSLLTKSLDLYMKRLGKEYLDETLGERIRDIDESDPDCEVDPNRVKQKEDLQRNWRNLIALTESVWIAIKASPGRCPPELRAIFRHIRACADDRYGGFLRNIKYSSVSGFLFLRFFCPAVLNPKLFGLLKDHPRPRALRTLTLIAKSLQCLANLSSFGNKEPWMEPMNLFISNHRQDFKDYIDQICTISTDQSASRMPPSYATPVTIFSRLPPTAKEGFPSLPYLIDQARELASLTNTWIEATGDARPTDQDGEEIVAFDRLCYAIREQTKDTINRALRADQPSGAPQSNLEELVENYDRQSRAYTFLDPESNSSIPESQPNSPTSVTSSVAVLTQTARRLHLQDGAKTNSTGHSSRASLASDHGAPGSPVAAANPEVGSASAPWGPSPATSAAPSAAGGYPSETESAEQFPTHAISWDKSSARDVDKNPEVINSSGMDTDDSDLDVSMGKGPGNFLAISTPPNFSGPESVESSENPFTMSRSTFQDKSPIHTREGSRKFPDVWGFRRKDKDKERSMLISDVNNRSDDSSNSAKRTTLTKKDRERDRKDREQHIRDLTDAGRASREGKELVGNRKSKGKAKK